MPFLFSHLCGISHSHQIFKKKAESELDLFCWGGKKKTLNSPEERANEKTKENVKFANGRGGGGEGGG